jgi:hypothetical protein
MAEVTDKELASKKAHVAKLRDQIRAEKQKGAARAAEGTNQLSAARLDVEAERLEAELAALRENNKDSKAVLKDTIASVTTDESAAAGQPDDEPEGDK